MNQALIATTANVTRAGSQIIDGVTLQLTGMEVVLVKDQITTSENGVYIVQVDGAWTLHPALDDTTELGGQIIHVLTGDKNGGTNWQCVSYPDEFRQITSFEDKRILDRLASNVLSMEIAFDDLDEIVTVAQGKRRSLATLTRNCNKTLSMSGALRGDVLVIDREDTSEHALRINDHDGRSILLLNRPGRATCRFDGTIGNSNR